MTESLQYELEVEGLNFSVICPGNIRTAIFGDQTPPPNSITVDDAVDYVFQELEKKSLIIILPKEMRDYDRLYREDRPEFDKIARTAAAERRENYRTKGTYY
jgi:short-subunit dehydrogenase